MDAIGETFICKHERTDLCERADIYELQYSGLTHARLPADFSSRHLYVRVARGGVRVKWYFSRCS